MFTRSKRYWCKLAHKRTTWPIHGHYVCLQCGTEFPVLWERIRERKTAGKRKPESGRRAPSARTAF
jgi:hypothetical protein